MNLIKNCSFDDLGIEVFSQKTETYLEKYSTELNQKLDTLLSTLDSYQSIILNFDIQKPVRCMANAGCLGAKSKIKINRAGKSKVFTIEEAYLKFHGLFRNKQGNMNRGYNWSKDQKSMIRSLHEDGIICLNEIEDIVQSGIKWVFPVTLRNKSSIYLTAEHLVKTDKILNNGWVQVKDLVRGDRVCVDTMYKHKKTSKGIFQAKKRDRVLLVGEYHPYARHNPGRCNLISPLEMEEHRIIYEAFINNLTVERFKELTYSGEFLCFKFIDPDRFHIHHRDHNHYNNDPLNLIHVEKIKHKRHHCLGYSNFGYGIPEFSELESVGDPELQLTYDICCKDPNNNFVAEGMVVHNSGKTRVLITRALKMVIQDKIPAHRIVLITFTNKAANDIKERYIDFFQGILSEEELENISVPHMSTIHSFGYTIISKLFGIFRTISNEYQSKKLMKQTMLEVLGEDRIEQKAVYLMAEAYASMAGNCEIHYAVLPLLENNGDLINVVARNSYGSFDKKTISFLDSLTYTSMAKRILNEGRVVSEEDKLLIVKDYAEKANLTVNQFVSILSVYYTHKYQTRVLDFADMNLYPLLFIAQHQNMLPVIWDRYQYFSMDEAQDSDAVQIALIICSDKDSYNRFLGGENDCGR